MAAPEGELRSSIRPGTVFGLLLMRQLQQRHGAIEVAMLLERFAEQRQLRGVEPAEDLRAIERARNAVRRVVGRAALEQGHAARECGVQLAAFHERLHDARADLAPPLGRGRRRDLLREIDQRLRVAEGRQVLQLLVDGLIAIDRVRILDDQRRPKPAGLGTDGDGGTVIERQLRGTDDPSRETARASAPPRRHRPRR